ncbi:MAG: pantetheine-phosphate adenylyltransferase [Bacteroidaceae bacterium]|nr:pantetheine-phosphate adenylyltransferase [Bacteroidaceae bacterium]MBR3856172.1 pantetheine-phosphate adenylyltransferase [Bacteroidaceae bacterium]
MKNNPTNRESTALFAGTFDPYTVGHHRIVQRALPLFARVVVAVGRNAGKQSLLSVEERVQAIGRLYAQDARVEVVAYDGLTVDFAKSIGADCLLRGVRSVKDFEYERELADINRQISGIETLLLISEPQYSAISSSLVRELMHYGKDVSKMLP